MFPPEARQRIEGWTTALEQAGADAPPLLSGDWSARSGYELGRRIATVREVTAIWRAIQNGDPDLAVDVVLLAIPGLPTAQVRLRSRAAARSVTSHSRTSELKRHTSGAGPTGRLRGDPLTLLPPTLWPHQQRRI